MRVPLWLDTVSAPNYPTLTHPLDVDVCIVGAGITGVTLAYLLKPELFMTIQKKLWTD